MTIELGSLNLKITATGREEVLKAMADIDAAGKQTAASVIAGMDQQAQATQAFANSVIAAANKQVQAYKETATWTAGLAALRAQQVAAGSVVGETTKGIQQQSTAVQGLAAQAQMLATALREMGLEEQAVQNSLKRSGLPPSPPPGAPPIPPVPPVPPGTISSYRQVTTAVDAVAAGMARASSGATAMAAGIGLVSEQQQLAAQSAITLANANARLLAGMTASGKVAQQATAGANAWARGMANLAVQQDATTGNFGRGVDSTLHGIRSMTAGFRQMAVVMLGMRSTAGIVATGLLMAFDVDPLKILGVVAAITAVTFVYEKLSEASRKTAEELKKVREELEKPTEQQAAITGRELIQKALDKAEQRLREAKEGSALSNLSGQPVIVDPKRVAALQAEVATLKSDLAKSQEAISNIGIKENDEEISLLTKAVELRTASNYQIGRVLTLLPQLKGASENETLTLEEQNKKREQYNALLAAFKKLADEDAAARKKILDAMRDEAALLVEISGQRQLTTPEIARLRGVYDQLTEALKRKNLTSREELDLTKAQTAALAELAKQTSATFNTKGSTFGQGTDIGRPKTPGLDKITFGADRDRTGDFFAGGSLETFDEDLRKAGDRAANRVKTAMDETADKIEAAAKDMQTRIANGLASALGDAISGGFERGIAAGSIGEGAKVLIATLLSALGSAAIAFGTGALAIAIQMELIKRNLMSLNPAGAIPAALLMIALGGALKGVASRMFNSGSGATGGSGGSSTPTNTTSNITVGSTGTVTRTGQSAPAPTTQSVAVAPTAAMRVAQVEPKPTIVFAPHIYGKDDLQYQRHLYETLKLAAGRGYKV
jgi:hypothetical protein